MSGAAARPDRDLKGAGRQCRYWSCTEPDPKYAVTWKCPAGHREESWYCAAHVGEMTAVALAGVQRGHRALCHQCQPALVFLVPVTEPRPQPRCAQCGHPGDDQVLYSWEYGGVTRFICRDSPACCARQLEMQAGDCP